MMDEAAMGNNSMHNMHSEAALTGTINQLL